MGDFRELRVLLALMIIALFTLAAYHVLSLTGPSSDAQAYRSAVLAVFALVWGLMCWLAYEDPVRFREIVMVTIAGLTALAVMEVAVIMTGHASQGLAVSPVGPSAPLQDALWGEVIVISALALMMFYFRPERFSVDKLLKE